MLFSYSKLIYFNIDCKICQAAFFKSPAKLKTLKHIHLLILFQILNENMFNKIKKLIYFHY